MNINIHTNKSVTDIIPVVYNFRNTPYCSNKVLVLDSRFLHQHSINVKFAAKKVLYNDWNKTNTLLVHSILVTNIKHDSNNICHRFACVYIEYMSSIKLNMLDILQPKKNG